MADAGLRGGLYVHDASLELLLYATSVSGAQLVMVPMMTSSTSDDGGGGGGGPSTSTTSFLRPLEDHIDIDSSELFHVLLADDGDMSSTACASSSSPKQRFYLLIKNTESWAHMVVGDARPLTCGPPTIQSITPRLPSWDTMTTVWHQAVFLSLAAVVLPLLDVAESSVQDIVCRLLALMDAAPASSATQIWVPCSASVAGWLQWNAFRASLLTMLEGEADRGLQVWIRHVRPVVVMEETTAGGGVSSAHVIGTECATQWCGEDVAAVLPSSCAAACDDRVILSNTSDMERSWADTRVPLWGSVVRSSISTPPAEDDMNSLASSSLTHKELLYNLECRGAVCFVAVPHLPSAQLAEEINHWVPKVRAAWAANPLAPPRLTNAVKHLADQLQHPLQPLGDHMANGVYAVFETDRPKYAQYHAAIQEYLRDAKREWEQCDAIGEAACDGLHGARLPQLTLMVLGAGRGPLVTECLLAGETLGVRVHVVIVEKNPAAVLYLQWKMQYDVTWQLLCDVCDHAVSLVPCDGRHLSEGAAVIASIHPNHEVGQQHAGSRPSHDSSDVLLASVRCVISELLGSGGDNELSPECIDGALRELRTVRRRQQYGGADVVWRPRHMVSIPMKYDLYVAPLHSTAFTNHVRDAARTNAAGLRRHPAGATSADAPRLFTSSAFHSPYVVNVTRGALVSPPSLAWTFCHPPTLIASDNTATEPATFDGDRSANVCFHVDESPHRVDGIVGYFTAELYRSMKQEESDAAADVVVLLSTLPSNWTYGMFSWFPLVLPLVQPSSPPSSVVSLERRDVHVLLRRVHNVHRASVHYEWALSWHPPDEDDASRGGVVWHNEGGWASHVRL